MAKHTQTICRQQPTNCLSVFNHFVGLALKGLNNWKSTSKTIIVKVVFSKVACTDQQIIRRQQSVIDRFVGLALKVLGTEDSIL